MTKVDGRRVRGDVTRRRTAIHAAELATVSGLGSISISQLADGTGLSKSGILTVFKSRESIQLAAVDVARDVFLEHVVTPAWDKKPGRPRLRAFVDNWFSYVDRGIFPGGCFLSTAMVEYGGQTGPVAEAVNDFARTWVQLLEGELAVGLADTKKSREHVSSVAFKLQAFMSSGNARFQLSGDKHDLDLARLCCAKELKASTD